MLWAAGDTRNPIAGLLVFDGYSVKATPEIPRSDRPPWSPRLRDCNHLIGTWANAIVEVTGDRLLDTDVRNGKHVRSQQVKYQEHLSSHLPVGTANALFRFDQRVPEPLMVALSMVNE